MRTRFQSILPVLVGVILVLTAIFLLSFSSSTPNTFADEDGITSVSDTHHVIIYDKGTKLSVKTDAVTVSEVLERANIAVNESDIVDPGLDTVISSNNFYINIYRAHPVVIIDGTTSKYLMTASYDPTTIANEAGLTIYDGDEIKLVEDKSFLEVGATATYKITRNGGRTITVEEAIPYSEEIVPDSTMDVGETKVTQVGEDGKKVFVYEANFIDGVEVSRTLVSETVVKEPVKKITVQGTKIPLGSISGVTPLTVSMGRNYYNIGGIQRQETYYDLNMSRVAMNCGNGGIYTVRADGAKIDQNGYVMVAANLSRYPRCSLVDTSLGTGKVYDTGGFAAGNPEQFDLATDWSDRNGI